MSGLIPQHFIDDLLERSDIVDIIGSRVQLKKTGRNFSGLCPFHQEKTPSFSVNQDKQFYYCFGCGAGGNIIQFLMDYEHTDFPQTVENLARHHNLDVPKEKLDPIQAQKQQAIKSERDKLYDLMEQIAQYFQQQLQSPQAQHARNYIQNRQLTQTSVENFQIGFAHDSWDALLQTFGNSDAAKQALFNTGMLVENDQGKIYDRFRNRIMFPIRDKRGRVIAFGGRTLGDDRAKYINSPETTLFNKSKELYGLYQAKQQRGEPEHMLICEGYMDVIALHQYGIHHAVATLGTATNELHLKTLFRYCPNLIFSFDGDAAGKRAAQRGMNIVLSALEDGREARFLFLPEGDDPDSFINQHGLEAFKQQLKSATPFSEYFFSSLLNTSTVELSIAEKARLGKQALPLIEKIPGTAYKQLMLQELQKRAHLNEATLQDLASNTAGNPSTPYTDHQESQYNQPYPPRPVQYAQRQHVQLTSEKRLLSLVLNEPALATEIDPDTLPKNTAPQILLIEVLTFIRQQTKLTTNTLLGHFLNHSQKEMLLGLLAQGNEKNLNIEQSRQELIECLEHLRTRNQNQAKQAIVNKIAALNNHSVNNLDPATKEQYLKLFKKK